MADPDNIPMANAIPIPPPILPSHLQQQQNPVRNNHGHSSFPQSSLPSPTAPTFNDDDAAAAHGSRGPVDTQQHAIERLIEQGFTRGLAEAVQQSKQVFQLSIWIVDNSGSMQHVDGNRIVQLPNGQLKLVQCTRWTEMQQTVEYHALMAAQLQAPTVFRLLNDPGRRAGVEQQFSIAQRGPALIEDDIAVAKQTMENTSPSGVTPLIPHLQQVRDNILALRPTLLENGTKVALVLATDGIPTNERGVADAGVTQQFVESLRALQGLPVWIVVRLCTDEEDVVQFWNSLDGQLELSLEVLDDFASEAAEVQAHNTWLNYGLPLHRMREMGFHHSLFDLLDERPLSKLELRDFFQLLFGNERMMEVPDPEVDWRRFYTCVSNLVGQEQRTWNPITKRVEPWIDLQQLGRMYGGGSSWWSWFGW
ncbi:hypothetical protein ACA910_019915 [Epithemia clementina (nom. ined.)]